MDDEILDNFDSTRSEAMPRGSARTLNICTEDLLGREPVRWERERVAQRIKGQVVMVTGAGGSIGSELCRQIAGLVPRALVAFEQAETPLFLLGRELEQAFPELELHLEMGSVTRFDEIDRAMEMHPPSIVLHAAAYKHVPMMETRVPAAVENNVLGTLQVARAAGGRNVRDFVFISTDKAVRPASVMGATKRAAELVIGSLATSNRVRFISVRFGNVLGSSGSVVPIFQEQIAHGGPVTVTHPEMSRYFMTATEAAQLVLEALALGESGEVLVLDMGEPVNIVELASKLIRLSGLESGRQIAIEFTGVRPGEKLREELSLPAESWMATAHPRIGRLQSLTEPNAAHVEMCLRRFEQAVASQNPRQALEVLQELVPEFEPGPHLRKHLAGSDSAEMTCDGNPVAPAIASSGAIEMACK